MNLVLPLLAAAAASAIPATPAPTPATPAPTPAPRAACREAIMQVRAQAGLPALDRGNAQPGDGLLIAAVDKRIDDCRVLVMARDTRDIRPEPEFTQRRAELLPAR